jgi:type I restriction enzyme S subunit
MSKVPEGWGYYPLGDIARNSTSKLEPKTNPEMKYIGLEHIDTDSTKANGFSYSSNTESLNTVFKKGDILFGKLRPYLRKSIVAEFDGCCCGEILVIKNIDDSVAQLFLKYVLRQPQIYSYCDELSAGTKMPRVSWKDLKEFEVLLPSLAEQNKIAEILSSVDRSIEATEKLIAKLADLKKALMQELFTKGIGHTKFKDSPLGRIPETWEVKILKSIASVKTGPFGAQLHESDYVSKGTPIITVEHLGEQGITYQNLPRVSREDKMRLSQYTLEAGDIVFSRVGSVDRNCLIKESENDWMFSGRLLRIRLNKKLICPSFISNYFHQEIFKQYIRSIAVGGTMASLNTSLLEDVLVPVPKLGEQTEIASILSANDAKIEKAQSRLNKLQDMKKGMMQDLLTGKRRVIQ